MTAPTGWQHDPQRDGAGCTWCGIWAQVDADNLCRDCWEPDEDEQAGQEIGPGCRVRLDIHSIGGRVERVTGTVTGPDRRGTSWIVATDSGHGEVVAAANKLTAI